VDDERANIGVCLLGEPEGPRLLELGRALLAERGEPGVRWRGGAGALWSGAGKRWHHPAGVVSCGDAAGLVDPINGEGITAALVSGAEAGKAVARYLGGGREAAQLEAFSTWVRACFEDRYAPGPLRRTWQAICGI
jgi:flavin-dependent dehydrogenase